MPDDVQDNKAVEPDDINNQANQSEDKPEEAIEDGEFTFEAPHTKTVRYTIIAVILGVLLICACCMLMITMMLLFGPVISRDFNELGQHMGPFPASFGPFPHQL